MKIIDYAIILNQMLWTMLLINHWYRGLEWFPILVLWIVMLGLFISPFMTLFNKNTVDDEIDLWEYEQKEQDYLEREYLRSIDESDNHPYKEEME
jgi:hypothetical protein